MINAKVIPLLGASFLAGLLGGLFSSYIVGTPLFAQSSPAPRMITAQRFALVDENGTLRGMWASSPDGSAGLVMVRSDGQTLSGQFMVDERGEPQLTFFNEKGKAVWMARH